MRTLKSALGAGAWCAVPLLALLIIYLPDLGHGFVKDDFAWILSSRVARLSELPQLFLRQNGFYRPLVGLSFALSDRLFGLRPFGYGLTNFALVLLAGVGIYAVGRALRMPWGAALLAASLWALNPHGVGGAILWISGRTSLLLIVFALGAALALVRGHLVVAAVLCAGALFSKEEAVLLPAILLVWAGLEDDGTRLRWRWQRAWPWAVASAVPLAAYFLLRSRTAAFLPTTAPAYYRLTLDPALLGRNVLEYADRSSTIMAAAVLLMALVARRWPRLLREERGWVLRGLAWLVGGFAITVFVPVRSSLYACFPSIGSALAGAAVAAALWRAASGGSRKALMLAAAVLPFALLPVYRARNERMVQNADLSAQVMEVVRARAADLAQGRLLVIYDDPAAKVSARNAFGTLITDAVRLQTGAPAPRAWYEPPLAEWLDATPPVRSQQDVVLVVRGGRLVPPP